MAIFDITARIVCDGCGVRFPVELDAAYKPPSGWSLFDVAQDALRGTGDGSVQGNHMLCRKCTEIVDNHVSEDRNATCAEVRVALRHDP